MGKGHVFISVSFDHRKQLAKEIGVIRSVVKKSGYEDFCFVQDYQDKNASEKKMMTDALQAIEKSVLLIAEVSHKQIGIGIEIGFAKALGIPIIYLRRQSAEVSTTTKGVCEAEIVYKNLQQLRARLSEAIRAILPNYTSEV